MDISGTPSLAAADEHPLLDIFPNGHHGISPVPGMLYQGNYRKSRKKGSYTGFPGGDGGVLQGKPPPGKGINFHITFTLL
jgi:hypothetical protein